MTKDHWDQMVEREGRANPRDGIRDAIVRIADMHGSLTQEQVIDVIKEGTNSWLQRITNGEAENAPASFVLWCLRTQLDEEFVKKMAQEIAEVIESMPKKAVQ